MKQALRKSPFACRRYARPAVARQGSAIDSLGSALTAVLDGPTHSKMQPKDVFAIDDKRAAHFAAPGLAEPLSF